MEKNMKKNTCVCMYVYVYVYIYIYIYLKLSLYYIAEINTTLQVNYPSIKFFQKLKKNCINASRSLTAKHNVST